MSLSPTLTSPGTWFRNPRVACLTTLAVVFLCGAVVGVLVYNLGVHNRLHKDPFWTTSGKALYLERVSKEADLTPAQTEQMESILDDFAKYYRTVLSDGKSRILQILNPDQKRKFEKLLQENSR